MSTQCDITMGNDIARDAHCEITMGNDVAMNIHYDITMNNDIDMCTYHGIIWQDDIAINLFYCVFSALYLIAFFYYGLYVMKTKTSECLISLGWRTLI